MKKFITRRWIFLISFVVALIFAFFFVPFIIISPPPAPGTNSVNPCPELNTQFSRLCNLNMVTVSVSLIGYLQDREPIIMIDWYIPVIVFIFTFAAIYIELKLLSYVITFHSKNKKKSLKVLLLKILAAVAFIYILYFITNLILNIFGLSLNF